MPRQMTSAIRVRNIDTVQVDLFIKDRVAKWACRPRPSVLLARLMQCALGNDRDWTVNAPPQDSKVTLVFNFRAGRLDYYMNETCCENDGGGLFGPFAPDCYNSFSQTAVDTKGFPLDKPSTPNWITYYDRTDTLSLCYRAKLARRTSKCRTVHRRQN